MPTLVEQAGGSPQKQPRYVPIFLDRTFTGIYTQRSVLHDPADVVTAKFYGGRPDALWMGLNIELTNRLTLQRRPGHTLFSTATYPTPPIRAYAFQLTDGTIRVIIDTASTGLLNLTSVSAGSGNTVYNGTFPCGVNNAFVGLDFTVAGFTNGQNNGTFLCVASDGTTITLNNANGVSETTAATIISYGAVYWDQQNGSKTLLFDKSAGSGQTYFQGSGGILYMGDGVDIKKYTPLNPNLPPGGAVSVWNWGIVAPAAQPAVATVASGAASTVWKKNTFFTTMGLTLANNQVWQLIGVNADGTNTASSQFGTAGNGEPSWNQALYGTTLETTGTPITWKNLGQIKPWQARTKYGDAGTAGTAAPCAIYDLASSSIYLNFHSAGALSPSGGIQPKFTGTPGSNFTDGTCHWFFLSTFKTAQKWKVTTGYTAWYTNGNIDLTGNNSAIEPFILPPPDPTVQPIYLQVPTNTGTSGSVYSPFPNGAAIGQQQNDAQLLWMCLGNDAWTANAQYVAWAAQGTTFSAIFDGVNMQVCTQSGQSGPIIPGTSWGITQVASASGGNTTYTGTFTGYTAALVGSPVVIYGFATASNNGKFTIQAGSSTTSLIVNNSAGAAVVANGFATYNPFANSYSGIITDGAVQWTCVGPQTPWVAGSATTGIWNLPLNGFQPPQSSQAFGGSTIDGNTNIVETTIVSGKSGTPTQPTWGAIHTNTPDPSTPLVLTSVAVVGATTTYNGTITGGAGNAFVGFTFLITGFNDSGNNGIVLVKASTALTLVCTTISQTNETTAATATTGLIWFGESAVTTNSLTWKTGYAYAYSFKARAFDDFYSPAPIGGGQIPPGASGSVKTGGALGVPTGSATNAVSTASPAFLIVGANAGAVNTVTGVGSIDPQVDTIIIWRSADGGGSGQMFELTEIPAPQPIGGIAQPWKFADFLPDTATAVYPGLNTLIPAPIDEVNNPPFSTFLPMVYNFQRIWGGDGEFVPFSGGPDTKVGNPDECFAPVDSLPFLAPVTRIVKTPQGLVTFLTDSIEVIGGGPLTSSFFSVTWAPGIGLLSYNALDILAGEMYFFSADNQFRIMTPSLNIANAGFALGDQFANLPSSGVSDTTWTASKVYVASHQNGIDNCVFVADGFSGWYRLNPRQAGALANTEPVWSPFGGLEGCGMVQSVETAPGIKKLLVGRKTCNNSILQRDLTVYTDSGVQYDAYFVMGSIMLAHPGQLALLKFVEFDMSGVNFQPQISYLLDEISGNFTLFTALPVFDPPSLYGGRNVVPSSYSPLRYYFLGNASLARCRHMQIKVDFGKTSNGDEMYNCCIFGRIMIET